MTGADVMAFQKTHGNHLGRGLTVDGVIGPETEWALAFQTLCQARREIVVMAQAYLGLTEDPPASNTDPAGLIRSWLARAGAVGGDPWCAAFASWCLTAGLTPPVKVAGAQALGRRFPATTRPIAGDVMWYPLALGKGHCGIVIGTAANLVMTIEGNSANAVRCVRRDRGELRFSRTVEDTAGTPPGIVPSVPPPPKGTR